MPLVRLAMARPSRCPAVRLPVSWVSAIKTMGAALVSDARRLRACARRWMNYILNIYRVEDEMRRASLIVLLSAFGVGVAQAADGESNVTVVGGLDFGFKST